MKIKGFDLDLEFVYKRSEWCDAPIKDAPAGWRQRRGYGNTCQRHAAYVVNGKKLCRLHAGNEVLDQLFAKHPTHFYNKANQPSVQVKPGAKEVAR